MSSSAGSPGAIVTDDGHRGAFGTRLGTVAQATGTALYAWALLSNHAHLLLRSGPAGLPRVMRRSLTGYAGTFNRRRQRVGHLFANRYMSIAVKEEVDFGELVRSAGGQAEARGLRRQKAPLEEKYMATESRGRLEHVLRIVGAVVTVGGLLFALAQFIVSQAVEAQKPYLEKKLAWCEEAANTAATISIRDRAQVADKEMRFWELYWGVMGLVENKEVTEAMIAFGEGLNGRIPTGKSLKSLSLAIAHACRQELARDWSPIWKR